MDAYSVALARFGLLDQDTWREVAKWNGESLPPPDADLDFSEFRGMVEYAMQLDAESGMAVCDPEVYTKFMTSNRPGKISVMHEQDGKVTREVVEVRYIEMDYGIVIPWVGGELEVVMESLEKESGESVNIKSHDRVLSQDASFLALAVE